MSEKGPAFNHTSPESPYEELNELDLLDQEQRRLEEQQKVLYEKRAQKIAEIRRYEAAGKYDTSVPNIDEYTRQSYLDQRPSDGVIREGSGFRKADNGQFASEAAYAAQNGSAQDHYDTVGGIENKDLEQPNFEDLSFMELVKEAAKASTLGDIAGIKEVRDIAEHNLMVVATEPGSEWTQEQFDEQMKRFDTLTERLVSDNAKTPAETAPADPDAVAAPDAEPVVGGDPALKTEPLEMTLEEAEAIVAASLQAPTATPTALPAAVTTPANIPAAQPRSVPVGLPVPAPSAAAINIAPVAAVKSVDVLVNPADIPAGERLKAWWDKNGSGLKDRFKNVTWAKRWTTPNDAVISRRVAVTLPEAEAQHKRNRNRALFLIGGAVTAMLAIGLVSGSMSGDKTPPTQEPGNSDASHPGVIDDLNGSNREAPAAPATSEVPIDQNFYIANDGNATELFQGLGIDIKKLYNNAAKLIEDHPGDFYAGPTGDLRLAHPGLLSEGARDAINKLR